MIDYWGGMEMIPNFPSITKPGTPTGRLARWRRSLNASSREKAVSPILSFRFFLIIADPIRELVKAFFDVRSKALIGDGRLKRLPHAPHPGVPLFWPDIQACVTALQSGIATHFGESGTAEQFAEIALHDRFCLGEIVRMHLADPPGFRQGLHPSEKLFHDFADGWRPRNTERHKRFVDMAREVEASDDPSDFDKAFEMVATPKSLSEIISFNGKAFLT
jgi:hypothetical protein